MNTNPKPVAALIIKNPAVVGSRVLKVYFANCANCHGLDAMGGTMAPALVRLAKSRCLSKSFLIEYLMDHKREPSPGSMPKFKQLVPEDPEAIAEWLLTLDEPIEIAVEAMESEPVPATASAAPARKSKKVEEVVRPSTVEAAALAPPQAFTANCAFCHGPQGEGNTGLSLVGITEKNNRSKDDLIKLLTDSRSYGLKDPMPANFPTLSNEDRKQIIEWLSKLKWLWNSSCFFSPASRIVADGGESDMTLEEVERALGTMECHFCGTTNSDIKLRCDLGDKHCLPTVQCQHCGYEFDAEWLIHSRSQNKMIGGEQWRSSESQVVVYPKGVEALCNLDY